MKAMRCSPHIAARSILILGTITLGPPTMLSAQEAPDESVDIADDDTIVVRGERLRGQLLVEQPPIAELDEADIEALGAGSIEEVLEAIAPQTGSARGRNSGGRPIFLVNGIRVASFREFRSYPPEAIAKVEVFAEEVAQRFGFSPDRRVVNFILKNDYSSREVEAEYEQPASGGYARHEQEFTLLKITDGGRINVNLEAENRSILTESERGLELAAGSESSVIGDPLQTDFRSLVSEFSQYQGELNYVKAFIDSGASLSTNLTASFAETRSLSGLDSVVLTGPDDVSALRTFNAADPLETRNRTDTYSTAATYQKPLWGFQFTATADASYTDSRSEIDRLADTSSLVEAAREGSLGIEDPLPLLPDAGFDVAQSDVYAASTLATLRGAIADLPAGELITTFRVGYDWDRIESEDTRSAVATQLTRGDVSGAVNVVLPIASTRRGVWDAIGSVSLNGQFGVNHLSDFGTLTEWSTGLNWQPFDNLSLQATYIAREAAPGLSQLGAPETITLNVPTFDFATGDTVLATIISGGNPDLLAETQNDWKFSANWELPFIENITVTADYAINRSEDVTADFPILTEAIEAAFPDRVERAADGTLLSIDRKPITYFETKSERVSLGLLTRGSFGQADKPEAGGGGGARGGRGGGGGGGVRMPGRGGDGRGRYFLSFNHTVELQNEILVAPDGPLIDQLNGGALSSSGVVEHSSRLRGGLFRGGWGVRLSGTYTGETFIEGSDALGSSDLFFGDFATFDLRVFADLGRVLGEDEGPLKGFRVSLRADNIFDARRRVVDADGDVPLQFEPLRIDPTGRYLGIDLRKVF